MELDEDLLSYWQTTSLALEDFYHPTQKLTEISQEECSEGIILAPALTKIFPPRNSAELLDANSANSADAVEDQIPILPRPPITKSVIIAPITLTRSAASSVREKNLNFHEDAVQIQVLPLFCLYAQITNTGQILANKLQPLPWVPRFLTEPTVTADFCLGTVEQFDHYYNYSPPPWKDREPVDWAEQLEYGYNFFQEITKGAWEFYTKKLGYTVASSVSILSCHNMQDVADLKTFTSNTKKRKIWKKIFEDDYSATKATPNNSAKIYQSSSQHCAHVINKHSLSMQQRNVLTQALALTANEIMFVQASYGTGKSTIIQDFVATKWVQAILENTRPPTIATIGKDFLVQKLTILDCLPNGSSWLAKNQWQAFYQQDLITDTPKSNITLNFLAQCSKEFGKEINNLATAKLALRERLRLLHDNLSQGIEAACSYHALTRQIQLSYRPYGGINRRNRDIKEASEKQISYVHYLEVLQSLFVRQITPGSKWRKWLDNLPHLKTKKIIKSRAFILKHLPDENLQDFDILQMQEHLQTLLIKAQKKSHALADLLIQIESDVKQLNLAKARAKRLIPDQLEEEFELAKLMKFFDTHLRYRIFLTAVHYWEAEVLQKSNWDPTDILHEYYAKKPTAIIDLIKEPVDCLIVENAHYLSPADGFYCVEGSKNLIVMGDNEVINPARIPAEVDLQFLRQANLLNNEYEHDIEDLQLKGILLGNGDFSTIGELIADYKGEALWLNKQFDITAKIIECQNELSRQVKLQPCKKTKPNFIEEFSYLPVNGCKELYLGSYRNDLEVVTILNWLKAHEASILARYPEHSLADIILVCTTFYGQSLALREAFSDYNLEINNIELVQNMHTKRAPIVIFSPVYTRADKGKLSFDQGEQILRHLLLSVKEHLLVFGDKDIFNQTLHSPSGKFAKYLFATDKNELVEEYEEQSIL